MIRTRPVTFARGLLLVPEDGPEEQKERPVRGMRSAYASKRGRRKETGKREKGEATKRSETLAGMCLI